MIRDLFPRAFHASLLFALVLLTACDRHVVVDEHLRVKDEQWSAAEAITVETQITDTLTPHDIYINLRHSGNYRFSNLFLFLDTYTPNGQQARDTVELTLCDERGQWLGEGFGDVHDNRILFKKDFVFRSSGNYRFTLTQAMRIDPLPGIMDAGIRIEQSKK